MRHTNIINIVPTKAHLQMEILNDKSSKPPFEHLALLVSEAIDLLDVKTNNVDAF